MSAPVAESVMAATSKLVQQALCGQWHEVPKTLEERRVLLERISADASGRDSEWLGALKQAMRESDALVAELTAAAGARVEVPAEGPAGPAANEVHDVMDLIARSR